ncbi:MAG: methyltransferase domain-containing protein [Bacteroidia bacterium]|nr:methyltransferase domain-containing protein [Bacteroidia bacterium]MCF8445513.1 methyltransferase domain-containing protein [Bacteroidia bacterium]
MEKNKEWFEDWFDSPYYHILYGNRDMQEAEFFLKNLINRFKPNPDAKIIDLACGMGRHSIYLNSLGFDVTGVDLAAHSIEQAKKFENEQLHFQVCDLRELMLSSKFDIALNLFTSFAYFDSLEVDRLVLERIYSILQPGGYLLIDFFNAHKVLKTIVPYEEKVRDGILFKLKKEVIDGKIIKTISFDQMGKNLQYQEKVQTLGLTDFESMFEKVGFKSIENFGAYDLSPFNIEESDRLILLVQKSDVR